VKTLYLLRHAKSSWDRPELKDHDRPLASRGEAAAPRMGRHLRDRTPRPQRVLCSSAQRARQTWGLVAPQLIPAPEVEIRRDIYDAEPAELLAIVQALPDTLGCVMILGHNPALEDLAAKLAGAGSDDDALQQMSKKFPTAALAEIGFDVAHWHEISPGGGRLVSFLRPKDLAD